MRVVACVCVRMCGRECACLRVREDHSVQGSKEGFEGFSDTFAVKDRLPRFDVMLAPAMALGSVRALLFQGALSLARKSSRHFHRFAPTP